MEPILSLKISSASGECPRWLKNEDSYDAWRGKVSAWLKVTLATTTCAEAAAAMWKALAGTSESSLWSRVDRKDLPSRILEEMDQRYMHDTKGTPEDNLRNAFIGRAWLKEIESEESALGLRSGLP